MILNRDDYFKRVNEIIGDSSDEKSIKFVEDMTDTYNALENNENISWEEKYKENDAAWRKKYQERFFSSGGRTNPPVEVKNADDEMERLEQTSFKDLFK